MQNYFASHRYWIISWIAILGLIIVFYPLNPYESMELKTTRPEAVEIAKEFLTQQNIDPDKFYVEAFLDYSPVEIRYIIKKLGGKEFKNYGWNEKWSNLSWTVYFHQNLPRQMQQLSYTVDVSNTGEIFGFNKTLTDTTTIPSLSKSEATELISLYLSNEIGNDFREMKLIETREENFRNRTDFSFRWERTEPRLNAKIVITSRVSGNTIGGYSYYFEVPQQEREYFEASEAIYGTVSVIFVIFLIILAFYLFLKKYHQGEVWISVGRIFFILYFLLSLINLINYWPAIGQGAMIGDVSFLYTKIIVLLVNGLIISFFMSILIFASWTVGESYARSLWPGKLKGIDAFIKGHFFAIDSGTALFKGFVLGNALAFSYLVVGLILNKPEAKIFLSPAGLMEGFASYIPVLATILEGASVSILAAISVPFFIVNISYQRWKRKWVSILLSGLVTTLAFVIASTPPSLNNFAINLLAGFIFGCGIAYIYFLFDLLTIISLSFTSILVSRGYVLYAADNPAYDWNFAILIIAYLAIPVIYLVSRIRKEEFILGNYGLPSHVQRISERERLKKEMEIAAKVQLSLLPKEEPVIPGYEIGSISIPAVEAGGDYYDFVKLSGNKVGIAIGDVSGKGIGAAIYMTLTKGILQAHAEENISPSNVLVKVNRLLYKTIEKNSFVSMFYAILNVNNNTISYSRAGHNPGILCSQEAAGTRLLLSKGMALGLEEGSIFSSTLKEEEIEIKRGDLFVLYTDGFTEAMNEKHDQYGEDTLVKLLEKNRHLPAKELIHLVLKDVRKFVDNYPQHDDMTMVVLKRI
ncbi:MAG TPA: PP2C family protein-serine/threonine phosphatase [Melioribacteraceae bacterium]|nr:PP2C family protein-serine/threonine phosphatase [Melioribacteraceae bacterium]